MKLTISLPARMFLEAEASKVTAEAQNGYFCLLPRHVDFVTALVPGILSFENEQGREVFLGVDEGVLVKLGDEVLVSTRNAVKGPDLGVLERTVREEFSVQDDQEKTARSAMAKIESSFVRRFLEVQKGVR